MEDKTVRLRDMSTAEREELAKKYARKDWFTVWAVASKLNCDKQETIDALIGVKLEAINNKADRQADF